MPAWKRSDDSSAVETCAKPAMNGVIVVDKPSGMTSHDVVQRARRLLGQAKIGHAGTLDPLATGVLPLMLGSATRLLRVITSDPKIYRAQVRLGWETNSGDSDGEPTGQPATTSVGDDAIASALTQLRGSIMQVPPMFSAKKIGGRRLYRDARRGIEVERAAVPVEVHRLEMVHRAGDELTLEIDCSPGTYVRSIAVDLGRLVGVGAHIVALRRLGSGRFTSEHCIQLADLGDRDAVDRHIMTLEEIPLTAHRIELDSSLVASFSHGRAIEADLVLGEANELLAVHSATGQLLGLAEPQRRADGGSLLLPRVVLEPA